uniref:Uncharacterized protein n=1 Tax=Anopheles arabiensis TaxID=7173 RepID=A0A182IFN4_ANOAR
RSESTRRRANSATTSHDHHHHQRKVRSARCPFSHIPSSNTLFILLFCLFDCSVFGVFPVVGCRRLNFPSAVYFRARARSNPPFKTTTALKQLLSSDNAARQSVRIVLSFIRFRNREHQLRDFATFDQTVTIHTCALILIIFFSLSNRAAWFLFVRSICCLFPSARAYVYECAAGGVVCVIRGVENISGEHRLSSRHV